MKAFRFLFLLIVATVAFSAQFVIVKDVTELPGDLTAQRYGYKDVNGQWCAILKVHSDVKDMSFASTGYEKHDYQAESGIYLVYLQPETKNLRFMKEGFIALNHVFPIKLKSNAAYQIDIKSIGEEKKIEDITINFSGEPESAKITLDGVDKGISRQIMTSVGKHEIVISKEGYQPEKLEIEVSPNKTMFEYKLEKLRDAVIEIATEPVGATVFLNGVKLGSAPLSELYPIGVYKIKVELQDYDIIEEDFEIRLPDTKKNFKLDYIGATLTINTHEKAKVSINGNEINNLKNIKLTPQIANIKVELKGTQTLTKKVILSKKDNQTLDMYPDVKTGTVQVVTDPIDAEVELFDDTGIKYTSTGNKIFTDVPVGKYELKVSKNGYQAQAQDVNLVEGVPEKKIIKLEPGTGIVKTDERRSGLELGVLISPKWSEKMSALRFYSNGNELSVVLADVPGFGGDVKFVYLLNRYVDLTLKVSYYGFSSDKTIEDSLAFSQPPSLHTYHQVSTLLGFKIKLKGGLYTGCDVGICRVAFKFGLDYDDVEETDIIVNPALGYSFKRFDVSGWGNFVPSDIGSVNFYGLRLGYKFWLF